MAEAEWDQEELGGEEEGEDAGQLQQAAVLARQEPPPESDSKKKEKADKADKAKGKKKKPPPPIRVNLSACKYEVLRIVQRKLGWKEVGDDEDWELYWTDTSVSIERIMKLTRVQKINHFSGMLEICRKRAMARNLMKMARTFPQHFDFFPRTFVLPGDREELLADIRARGKKQVYILKPDAGCQGRGIRLLQGGKEELVTRVLGEMATPNVVAQHYLTAPMLIHGYKFDLRIYALVLACDPMRVFLFHEGLARICTEKYAAPKASNLDVSFMHLTNYAVNKKNDAFVAAAGADADSGEDASKWCLAQLRTYINGLGHSYDKVWADIADLIIKSLCSVQPVLRNNYRSVLPPDNDGFSCFEILGYDVMLDDQLRPWLIEVNHSPSFNIDSPLDLAIKEELITQTIELVRVDPKIIAKTKKAERRAAASRLLEPMHVKKALPLRSGGPLGGGGGAAGGGGGGGGGGAGGGGAGGGEGKEEEGSTAGGGGGGGGGYGSAGAAAAAALAKPRTPEEYEAWRAKVLAGRERWESKHSGNFDRIFPSPDPTKQALYEELLKGASDIYQASFQARSAKPSDDKKKKEETETETAKAERLKAKAHRDKLAQMAVERRKIKMQQQAAAAQGPGLPAYLNPPPYLAPPHLGGGGMVAMPYGYGYSTAPVQQQGQYGQGQGQAAQYTPLMAGAPPGSFAFGDPTAYNQHQMYMQQYQQYQQQAANGTQYGGGSGTVQQGHGGGGGGPSRMSEVYGERSDGAASTASSRPVSAMSTASAALAAGGGDASASGQHHYQQQQQQQQQQPAPLMRIYSGHRTASGSAPRTGSPAGGHSGRSSPALTPQLQQLLQQPGQQQQPLHTAQIQQGALPPNPFLGGSSRRPASAASLAGGGGGGAGNDWSHFADAPSGRGVSALCGARAGSPSPTFPAGAPLAAGFARAGGVPGGVPGNGGCYGGYGGANATALQQLQQLQQAAAALSQSQQSHGSPAPGHGGHPVPVGSAHNHVRHAHSGAVEAPGAAAGGGGGYAEPGPGEREQHREPGSGLGLGASGSGRNFLVNGSRPPSASAVPTSLRDKLQPGAAAAAAAIGGGGGRQALSMSATLANAAAAATTWDAAMAAAAAAAGQDPATVLQYLGSRPRPLSAGQGLRPTSASATRRSPSPLGSLPPSGSGSGGAGGAAAAAALSALGAGTTAAAVAAAAAAAAGGSGGSGGYSSSDVYLLGLTQHMGQPVIGGGAVGPLVSSSPKLTRAYSGQAPTSPRSPILYAVAANGGGGGPSSGPWDNVGGMAGSGGGGGSRAYKQTRVPGLPAAHMALPLRPAAAVAPMYLRSDDEAADDGDGNGGGGGLSYQPLAMPDSGGALAAADRYSGGGAGAGGGGRHWSSTNSSAASPGAPGSARQRSFTTGANPALQGAVGGSGGGGGGASGPLQRLPVYPPSGGSPGPRSVGAPASGRPGGGGGGSKVGGGSVPTVRLNSALNSALAGGGAASHPPLVVSGGGGMLVRGGGGGGGAAINMAGSVVGVGSLQGGLEGLQITAMGMDMDSQMRNAALQSLNRRALTVTGKNISTGR